MKRQKSERYRALNEFCPHCGALFAPDPNLEFSTTQTLCVECGLPLEGPPPLAPAENDNEQVAYDLIEWPPEDRVIATDDLLEAGIPYRWDDGVVLVVPAANEAQVDELLDEIDANAVGEQGEAALIEVEAGEDGGEEATAAMGELFVAADGLSHGTYDEAEVVDFMEAAAAVAQSLPPFGIEPQVWGRIQSQSAAIVAELEKGDEGDDDEIVTDGAKTLRDLLRHYV
jgi:hypothetical protein